MVFSYKIRVKDSPFQYENIGLNGKEMDTYKVATVSNSTSTMHKLTSQPITKEMFSFDGGLDSTPYWAEANIIRHCEALRQEFLKTKDKRIWRALIQLLPSAYNQKRTWTANYQVLRNIYFQRRFHKLQEWRNFCEIMKYFPYAEELITIEKDR